MDGFELRGGTLHVHGVLSHDEIGALRQALDGLLSTKHSELTIDLTGVTHISIDASSLLAAAGAELLIHRRRLRLLVNRGICPTLLASGMARLFPVLVVPDDPLRPACDADL